MAGSILVGSVAIRPSSALLELLTLALEELGQDLEPPPGLLRCIEGGQEGGELRPEELRWVGEHLAKQPRLAELLLDSVLQLPTRVAAQRSEELERRCEKLRVEQEERDYRRMTNNVRRDNEKEKGEEPIKKQLKEVNGFLLLILQFIVSVVCAFMAGYMGPYLLYGKTDMGGRLLLGIIAGFVVGCADMYFVIRQLLEEDGIMLKKID